MVAEQEWATDSAECVGAQQQSDGDATTKVIDSMERVGAQKRSKGSSRGEKGGEERTSRVGEEAAAITRVLIRIIAASAVAVASPPAAAPQRARNMVVVLIVNATRYRRGQTRAVAG